MDLALISTHWPTFASLMGLVIWLVRMEGKTLNNEKRLDHAEAQLDNLESGLVKEINEVKITLARIESYLKAKAENQEH